MPLRGAGGEPVSFARTVYSHGCAQLAPAAVSSPPLRYRRALRIDGRVVDVTMRGASAQTARRDRRAAAAATARHARGGGCADVPLRRRPVGILRARRSRRRLGVGGEGSRENFGESHGFRRRHQNDLHHELCLVGDDSHDPGARRTRRGCVPRDAVCSPRPASDGSARLRAWGIAAPTCSRSPAPLRTKRSTSNACATRELDSDADVEESLLALPGIGPYGAAHVMQLLGRHRALILDSWTRPNIAISGRKRAADSTHSARVCALRSVRGPRVLALSNARLGRRLTIIGLGRQRASACS